jgi:hypothetical protein
MTPASLFTGLLTSGLAALTVVATQALTGRERAGALFFGYSVGWFLLFGAGATLPLLSNATTRQSFVVTFAAFGAGGGVAGMLVVGLLTSRLLGGSPTSVIMDFAIPFAVPWFVGSVILRVFRRLHKAEAGLRGQAQRQD